MTKDEIQDECLKTLIPLKNGTSVLSVGVGKTRIALRHIDYLFQKGLIKTVLVVIPKISTIKTWKDEIALTSLNHLNDIITYTTYRSLNKQSKDYSIVYFDEIHNILKTHNVYLKDYQGYVFGLTGTLPIYKSNIKRKMIDYYAPVVFKCTIKEAVDNKIINDVDIIIHYIPLSDKKDVKITTAKSEFFVSELDNYNYICKQIENNPEKEFLKIMRTKILQEYKSKVDFIKKLKTEITEKCLIFVNSKIQAQEVCSHSYFSGNELSDENLLKFKKGIIKQMSCILQLSEGINIPDLRCGIISHSFGNEFKLNQRIGRLCRLNPDQLSTVHILCYKGTIDETWVEESLKDLNHKKIKKFYY
jgi:superfamily II DNA or RNA helicase